MAAPAAPPAAGGAGGVVGGLIAFLRSHRVIPDDIDTSKHTFFTFPSSIMTKEEINKTIETIVVSIEAVGISAGVNPAEDSYWYLPERLRVRPLGKAIAFNKRYFTIHLAEGLKIYFIPGASIGSEEIAVLLIPTEIVDKLGEKISEKTVFVRAFQGGGARHKSQRKVNRRNRKTHRKPHRKAPRRYRKTRSHH